jgi:DNA-binding transcriptional regulator GbsR (MarR family)
VGADTRRIADDFVQLWGRLGPLWGVTPVAARMYAWLLCQAEPQEAEVIGETLGISRGAVSMGCAELVDWRLVHADRVAGSRRIVYRPETDPERVIRSILQTRKRREWDPILEHLRPWLADLRGDRSAEAARLRARLEAIERLITVADEFADRFLQGSRVQRLGLKAVVAFARGSASRKVRRTP